MANRSENLEVVWLGRIEYRAAWELQNRLAAGIASGKRPPILLLLEHPHVYTIGRRGGQANLIWDERTRAERGIDLVEVDRGGDITYHGPGQLVGYPLVRLAQPGWQGDRLPQADYVGYLRRLETVLIEVLASFGITAFQKEGYTGVWVSGTSGAPDAKIASIGVKVDARGVTRHGFALNLQPDMAYWQGIVPCGLDGVHMASMADLISPPPDLVQVGRRVAEIFAVNFGFEMAWIDHLEGLAS